MLAPLDGAVGAASTVLSILTTAVAPLVGPHATALAIVALTIAVRLLISPLTLWQVRGERRRHALAPRLRELRRRHRRDPAKLSSETMALYRAERAHPLGGCLPALLQAPAFVLMFRLTASPPPGSDILAATLFGVPLGHQVAAGLATAGAPVCVTLLAVLAVLAWWLSRRMRRTAAAAADPEAPGAAATAALVPLLPYGVVVIAMIMPLAVGIYLVATTAWTALEHATLRRAPYPAAASG